jgi:hypothetical protein
VAWHTAGEEITEGRIDGVRRRGGGRKTPVSDDLHGRLRNPLKPLMRVDDDYDDYFDKLEVMLGLIGADVAAQEKTKNFTFRADGLDGTRGGTGTLSKKLRTSFLLSRHLGLRYKQDFFRDQLSRRNGRLRKCRKYSQEHTFSSSRSKFTLHLNDAAKSLAM